MKKSRKPKALQSIFAAALTTFMLVGCDSNENFVFTNSQPQVIGVAPTAQADQYLALGNTTLNVNPAQGVLSNDTNAAGSTVSVIAQPNQGTVVVEQDGSFTFNPPTGFTGQATFTYELENQFGDSTADVTITLNQSAWFVNNSGGAGDGSQGSPFATLKAAEAASVAGDTIFVFAGDQTSTGQDEGIILKPNQILLGENVGFAFANGALARTDINAQLVPDQVIVPADGNVRPVITNPAGVGIQLAESNTVRGIRVENTATECMLSSGLGLTPGHIIRDNQVSNPGANAGAINLFSMGGTTEVVDNEFTGIDGGTGTGLILSSVFSPTDNPSFLIDGNTFTDVAGDDPDSAVFFSLLTPAAPIDTGTPSMTFTFTDNLIVGDNGGGSFETALTLFGELDNIGLGAGITGQFSATLDNNVINGTDDIGLFVEFLNGENLPGNFSLALSMDQNDFDNTGDEAIEVYLGSMTTTGTISGNTKDTGDGGGIDLRTGRDSAQTTNTDLTIAQNSFTQNGSNERGIQIQAQADDGASTIFCIGNTISDDGDALTGYRILSQNDSDLTVVSDDDTVSGFASNGLVAVSQSTSILNVAVRGGDFTGANGDEGVFMEGQNSSTLCAQVLNTVFDAFRIRQDAGSMATVQLEALPAATTVDTNTGPIDSTQNVVDVNLGDCNIPATPTL